MKAIKHSVIAALALATLSNRALAQETTAETLTETARPVSLEKKLMVPDEALYSLIDSLNIRDMESLNADKKYNEIIYNYDAILDKILKYEVKDVQEDKKSKLSAAFDEIGFAYSEKKLWQYAQKYFNLSHKLDDKNLYSLINLSRASLALKDYKNAVSYAQQYLDKNGENRHLALQIIKIANSSNK